MEIEKRTLFKISAILMIIAILLLLMLFSINASTDSVTGKASWYSKNDPTDPWAHVTTASGEPFDENAFTCAMRNRDFGGLYKVTNIQNDKSVIVKHTDFGPALKYKGRQLNRIIDLSKAAFQKIANLDSGVIRVRIEMR